MPKKDCDLDKEDRLKSGRCVKKCPDGSTRHETTERCRKNQTMDIKSRTSKSKSKSKSKSPPKKKSRCANGYRRNKAGDCIPNGKPIARVPTPVKQPSPLLASSSETTTVPMNRTPSPLLASSSETTTVPMNRTPSIKKPDSWDIDDVWDKPKLPTRRRKPEIIYKPYNSASVITRYKKKKRSPLGKLKVYERLNQINKEKFKNASPTGKRNLLEEYQVNPRNTESGSYAVPGIDPSMYAYYNMLADKHKTLILNRPKEARMDILKYIYALDHDHNREK
jgi:hypothetical protein